MMLAVTTEDIVELGKAVAVMNERLYNMLSRLQTSDFITMDEAVEITGLTKRQITLRIEKGDVIGKKVGRLWQIYTPSLKPYISRRAGESYSMEGGRF